MQLASRDVIRVPDPRVRPKGKAKWHVCVCPSRRLFLRINTKPAWPPHHPIKAANNAFLKHDSHVELTTLHFFTESELRQATKIGVMSESEAADLLLAVLAAPTLSQEHKDIADENFPGPLG
jgi:hypothetical protein